jgi:hypothetical protein
MSWDAFISHASEDKEIVARPLCHSLQNLGLKIWFDEFTLTIGDSLRQSIDRGLADSRFGVVIVSPDFLRKAWPQRELDGLVAREVAGTKVILPVWHNIEANEILRYSPPLADRLAAKSSDGLSKAATQIAEAIRRDLVPAAPTTARSIANYSAGKMLYCHRCGAVPGERSVCNGSYTSHDFRTSSSSVFCNRCGAIPGKRSICNGSYTSHDFRALSAIGIYCHRCGATPGERSICNGSYVSHDFRQI